MCPSSVHASLVMCVTVHVFALDSVAQNSDENSAQKFRFNFRDYFGEYLQLLGNFR